MNHPMVITPYGKLAPFSTLLYAKWAEAHFVNINPAIATYEALDRLAFVYGVRR
jgi:hypothetical protein